MAKGQSVEWLRIRRESKNYKTKHHRNRAPVSSSDVPVSSADDAEEAVLAPVGAPRVTHDPVLGAVLDAPAVDLHGVVAAQNE